MLPVILASVTVFSGVIMTLTLALILAERKLIPQGKVKLVINEEKEIEVQPGGTLLSTLANEKIFIPSACGGGGTCAMCKCQVFEGGGDILPTEKTHVNRKEEHDHVRLSCQVKIRGPMKIHVPDEVFSIRQYTGTVRTNENVATFIKYLDIAIDGDEPLKFKAGGYVQIMVPKGVYDFKNFDVEPAYRPDWDKFNLWRFKAPVDEEVFRAYSMANHPAEGNKVALTVRIATPPPNQPNLAPGLCTSYLFNLKPGDRVNFSGPYGEFYIKDTDREMLYIGGGAGMGPMRSHLFHLFHTLKTKRKVSFFYGARSMRENFFEDEFHAIEREFPNFKYILALSDPMPEDKWTGATGFIHQIALEQYLKDHDDPTEIEYYLCGPPMMLDAVINMLHEQGVEDEMIAFDAF